MRDDLHNKKPLLNFSSGNSPVAELFTIIKAMSKELKFTDEVLTVSQFKASQGTESIQFVRSPKTDKLFAADDAGNTIAAVSEAAVEADELLVTLCERENAEGKTEQFYLIHAKGKGGTQNVERTI